MKATAHHGPPESLGREVHAHRGCRIVRFDKRSRRRAARELGESFRRIERHLGAYAVIGPDDWVVTVGHRFGRRPIR